MNESEVRDLADKPSGAISMADFYGKSRIPSLGDPYQGGYYMGTSSIGATCYLLILAPKETFGASAFRFYQGSFTLTPGALECQSFTDGYYNTYTFLNNANHPAGNWTATRTLNGFDDWYLPAREELREIAVTNSVHIPPDQIFNPLNCRHWTSNTDCLFNNIPQAFALFFGRRANYSGCGFYWVDKGNCEITRPIRRLPCPF
jgi:hypothetical protein